MVGIHGRIAPRAQMTTPNRAAGKKHSEKNIRLKKRVLELDTELLRAKNETRRLERKKEMLMDELSLLPEYSSMGEITEDLNQLRVVRFDTATALYAAANKIMCHFGELSSGTTVAEAGKAKETLAAAGIDTGRIQLFELLLEKHGAPRCSNERCPAKGRLLCNCTGRCADCETSYLLTPRDTELKPFETTMAIQDALIDAQFGWGATRRAVFEAIRSAYPEVDAQGSFE